MNFTRDDLIKVVLSVAERNNIRILLAVEVGSRMWGLDSRDSDHDIRFIYVSKSISDYLTVFQRRDVIELKDRDIDLCGWDIKKALSLAQRTNSSIIEWLLSTNPLISDDLFIPQLKELVFNHCSLRSLGFSWTTNAKNDMEKCILNTSEPIPRDYLYVIRPLLSVRWLLDHRDSRALSEKFPPQRFLESLEKSEQTIPKDVSIAIKSLALAKIDGKARDAKKHDMVLEGWIASVLSEWKKSQNIPHSEIPSEKLDKLFYDIVISYSPPQQSAAATTIETH